MPPPAVFTNSGFKRSNKRFVGCCCRLPSWGHGHLEVPLFRLRNRDLVSAVRGKLYGHLNATPETVLGSAEGYYKRLWYDGANGAPLYDYAEQFEDAWKKRFIKNDKYFSSQ